MFMKSILDRTLDRILLQNRRYHKQPRRVREDDEVWVCPLLLSHYARTRLLPNGQKRERLTELHLFLNRSRSRHSFLTRKIEAFEDNTTQSFINRYSSLLVFAEMIGKSCTICGVPGFSMKLKAPFLSEKMFVIVNR